MNELLTALRRAAYESIASGDERSPIAVMNFIMAWIYDNRQLFDKPIVPVSLTPLVVFYFLCEEDARFDF